MTPDAHIQRLQSQDFTEMEEALGGWNHRYRQIGRGAFRGRLLLTQVGAIGIFQNLWGRSIHYQGVAPEGTIAFAVSLVQTGEARWMGQPMAFDDMIVQPKGAEGEYISAPLWDSVVLTIPEVDLLQRMADITDADPVDMLRRPSLARLRKEVAAQIRQACMAYLRTAKQHLAKPDAPSPLPEMAKSTVDLVARALVSSRPAHDPKLSIRRQRRLVANVVDYCDDRADQPIQIHEVCHELEVSERTLRYAFQHVIGASPLTFLKRQRLNRAYRALHKAEPGAVLIKQAAHNNGFSHLGQFSQDYKQLFGETPSETLQRG